MIENNSLKLCKVACYQILLSGQKSYKQLEDMRKKWHFLFALLLFCLCACAINCFWREGSRLDTVGGEHYQFLQKDMKNAVIAVLHIFYIT